MRFDCVVVDEAAQVAEPIILSALCLSSCAILVGDHFQLPPLARSSAALQDSLFRRLCELHPNAVARLDLQYRMNAAICSLCSNITYNNALKCGSDAVAAQVLNSPHVGALSATCDSPHFAACVSPTLPVVFLCTSAFGTAAHDIKVNSSFANTAEANIVAAAVAALTISGVQGGDIGVICPYRAQIAAVEQRLADFGCSGVEVHTVDRFQGRDKHVIILSLVRSNAASDVGELLKDWRRLNVAISRARCKLVNNP